VDRIVLDTSAVLAMVQLEPGGERVEALLDAAEAGADVEVAISSVNWCEILTRTQRNHLGMTAEKLSATFSSADLVLFGRVEAELAAGYARVNQALSLGDRACLALAKARNATVWTADRFWTQCKLDVAVELIRR